MREDVLQYIWQQQRFDKKCLTTSRKEALDILSVGQLNHQAGPDFFNARIVIDGQEWAGTIEVHLKSSDWYAHGHEVDRNYDSVILHVVLVDDADIFRRDGSKVPTLALQARISEALIASIEALFSNRKNAFINCAKDIGTIDTVFWRQWEERLFVERLQAKSKVIEGLLNETKNDWEAVLFFLLMKNFGLNKNGDAFLSIAKHIGFSTFKKVIQNPFSTESLLLGVSGLLEDDDMLYEPYFKDLQKEYRFLVKKFQLSEYNGLRPVFFGLRPNNFPTIRLVQLAMLYAKQGSLFQALMSADSLNEYHNLFQITTSTFWETHYTFAKVSGKRVKKLTPAFVELILINTVVPLKFSYQRTQGKEDIEALMDLNLKLPPEKNSIISGFEKLGAFSASAFESQAKIQLFNEYCTPNRCVNCQIGIRLLSGKN